MKEYYLDPDYRRDAPKDKPYCIRCQKEIKDIKKAVRVDFDENTIRVKQNESGEFLIGSNCWKQITKNVDTSK